MDIFDVFFQMILIIPTVLSLNFFLKFQTLFILRVALFFFAAYGVYLVSLFIESCGSNDKGFIDKSKYTLTFILLAVIAALSGYDFYIASTSNFPIYEQGLYAITSVYWMLMAIMKANESSNYRRHCKQALKVATVDNTVIDTSKKKNTRQRKKAEAVPQKSRKEVYNEALAELHSIIGMDDLKSEIERFIINMEMMKKKEAQGIKNDKQTMHMLFVGPPGTGKTTVARIIAKLLYGMGLLSKGQCVEARRKDLIAGYVGHTAGKTYDVIHSAIGGVLFIDEAYSLNPRPQGFEQEALDTLNQEMEENRKDLVVILAGYEDKMDEFLDANDGFRSRIPHKFHFVPYNENELYKICKKMILEKGYLLDDEADAELMKQIAILTPEAENSNGRLMRNYMERIESENNYRLKNENAKSVNLKYLSSSDIKNAAAHMLAQ